MVAHAAAVRRAVVRRSAFASYFVVDKAPRPYAPRDLYRFLAPNPYRETHTFCVVRDPLDRMLSEYKMVCKPRDVNDSALATAFILRRFNRVAGGLNRTGQVWRI